MNIFEEISALKTKNISRGHRSQQHGQEKKGPGPAVEIEIKLKSLK